MGKLTALQVKRAKPGRHGDGDGLYLVVSDTGAKKWVLRVVQLGGKRRDAGLGSLRNVTLAEARAAADEMRRAFRRGEDPILERRKERQTVPSFRDAALAVHAERLPGWKNPKHA